MKSVMSITETSLYDIYSNYATEKEKSKFRWCDQIKTGKMQRQQNLINDLIIAADGLQNLNTNANTKQSLLGRHFQCK